MQKRLKVLIVAEGTYPYVKGGVSSWIDQLINGLSEYDFKVFFIGSKREDYGGIQYKAPENLLEIKEFFIFDKNIELEPKPIKAKKEFKKSVLKVFNWVKKEDEELLERLMSPKFYTKSVTYEEFLYSLDSWEIIEQKYLNFSPTSSFIDYFWTIRNMHSPIWKIAQESLLVSEFDIVHSPSTGYAGFFASLVSMEHNKPFILTEHGIYTKERKIDMLGAKWIKDTRSVLQKDLGGVDHIKDIWISFFLKLGKIAYQKASKIISLYEDARMIQIDYGAKPAKTISIANGVDIPRLKRLRVRKKDDIVALIGRVVPIKDIKTFIKSMRITVDRLPNAQGWIIGPQDEDPIYANECMHLVKTLGLSENISFLGYKNLEDILPDIKILTLTSISEGMPLVLLEGFAAGIPAVATDVGSCSQLINGAINSEDIEIGASGRVVPIANPSETANAYIELLENSDIYNRCKNAAVKRVERFYSLKSFLQRYKDLYCEVAK